MPKKDFTTTSKVLMWLAAAYDLLDTASQSPYKWRNKVLFGDYAEHKSSVYYLHRKGLIKIVDKNNERFLELTKKGQLEALLAKARLPTSQKWDGKWRVVMFDIPEESREKRALLRMLLKKNNFKMLQASVFINPYPLNREAVAYLKQTGLIGYIRILKVEEMDDDSHLKKVFKLSTRSG